MNLNQQNIDFEKIIQYSKPGPRYTSYPTAVEFRDVSEQEYIQELNKQNPKTPLSLYFHLPFCKSACYFCGCSVIYTHSDSKKDKYVEYIKKEIDLVAKHIDTSRKVAQLHFGGGTPTYLSCENLEELINHIKKTFTNFEDDPEISCEVDPREFNEDIMKILAKGGFNRISFGVQDFDEKVQHAINRKQNYELVENVIEIARNNGVKSVNMDLIYGLPFQSTKSFEKTIDKAIALNPDRLAIFNYAHVPWIKSTMKKISQSDLPPLDEKMKILEMLINKLTDNGYKMIGMDHFAKPQDELFEAISKNQLHRNFQGYTTKGHTDLIGIGLTSIGYTKSYFMQNAKKLKEYEELLDNNTLPISRGFVLNEDDKIRQSVILSLMSNFYVSKKEIEDKFDINFDEYFKKEIEDLQEFVDEDFISIDNDEIKLLNQTAVMIIRNIVMVFDAYLEKHKQSKKTFSKTI